MYEKQLKAIIDSLIDDNYVAMNEDKLKEITQFIIWEVMRNPNIVFSEDENVSLLLDIIASLHNELYCVITGNYYGRMFHWANKVGYNGIEDELFYGDFKYNESEDK